MNIITLIEIFTKEGNDIIQEIDITHIPFVQLNEICPPEIEDDLQYCNGLYVEHEHYLELIKIIPELKTYPYEKFDFNIFSYQVLC